MALFRRFGVALAIIPVAAWVGYHYVFVAAPQAMDRALGVALLVYAGLGLRAVRLPVPARAERLLTPVVGVVNGLITGVTGTFVIPIVMYLEALGLDRDELVQMMGITFAVSTAALAGCSSCTVPTGWRRAWSPRWRCCRRLPAWSSGPGSAPASRPRRSEGGCCGARRHRTEAARHVTAGARRPVRRRQTASAPVMSFPRKRE